MARKAESNATEMQDWPDLLRHLATALGRDRALKLARRFGGVRIYVPLRFNPQHPWAKLVSEAEWDALGALRGKSRYIPLGTHIGLAKRRIIELAEKGLDTRTIALTLRVSQRHVQRMLSELGMLPPPRRKAKRRANKAKRTA